MQSVRSIGLAILLAASAGAQTVRVPPADTLVLTPKTIIRTDTVFQHDTVFRIRVDTICVSGNPPVQVSCGTTPVPPDTTTPPPIGTGIPDPTRLPIATPNMAMNVAAYMALNVRAKGAGEFYLDPITKVRITKVTSATYPASGQSWHHDYFEGGNEVSLPLDATGTRIVLICQCNSGTHYVTNVIPGQRVQTGRQLTGNADPDRDLNFTFSSNPVTPYYAYITHNGTIRRFDMRTITEAPGNGWPLAGAGDGGWLHQSENDKAFTWQSGATVHYYEPATGKHLTYTNTRGNEPRISRSGRYVGISMDSPSNGLTLVDFGGTAPLVVQTTTGTIPFAHNASLKDLWIGNSWNDNFPFPFTRTTISSQIKEWGPSVGSLPMGNGGWNQAGDQRQAWTVWNSADGMSGCGSWCSRTWTAPGGIVLVTMAGGAAGARLLAHPYSTQRDYFEEAWPKFSPDGKVVLFTSDMNGSGRTDLFLAELPLKP